MPSQIENPKDRIILGLMTVGPKAEDGARITDMDTFKDAMDLFQRRGYNEVDSARSYVASQQEAYMREAGWKERGLTLATKLIYPFVPGQNSADNVLKSVETSLSELGTDCIDILYIHNADRATPFTETLGALDRLHKQGKFKVLGISNFAAFEIAEIVMTCKYNNWVLPTVYQGMYNCITRNIEPEVFSACRRYGLEIVVYNVVAGGLFSGKFKSKDWVPETGRFSNENFTGPHYRHRYFRESNFKALQLLEKATEGHGLTLIETALRWMVHHSKLKVRGRGGSDGILIGFSSVEQLDSNLNDLEKGPLPEDVVEALDEAWMVAKADSAEYWHGELVYSYDVQSNLFRKSGTNGHSTNGTASAAAEE